uniref:Uncharacterized protein n=1 Tax=Anguilla anguilla TaxID=7936 RepID=A0A0E9S8I6_ANGAN
MFHSGDDGRYRKVCNSKNKDSSFCKFYHLTFHVCTHTTTRTHTHTQTHMHAHTQAHMHIHTNTQMRTDFIKPMLSV